MTCTLDSGLWADCLRGCIIQNTSKTAGNTRAAGGRIELKDMSANPMHAGEANTSSGSTSGGSKGDSSGGQVVAETEPKSTTALSPAATAGRRRRRRSLKTAARNVMLAQRVLANLNPKRRRVSKHYDGDGKAYFVDEETGVSAWEVPTGAVVVDGPGPEPEAKVTSSSVPTKPQRVSKHHDGDGNEFFRDEDTGIATWGVPEGAVVVEATFTSESEHAGDAESASVHIRGRFSRHRTDDGREYFVSEGTGDAVWELPADSEVV